MRVLVAALLLSATTAFAPLSGRHFGLSSTSRLQLSSVVKESTTQESSNVQAANKIRYVSHTFLSSSMSNYCAEKELFLDRSHATTSLTQTITFISCPLFFSFSRRH